MYQAALSHLSDIFRIAGSTRYPQVFAPFGEKKEGHALRHARERCYDESILQSHVVHPGRETITDGKGHCVPDNNDGDHDLSTHGSVRVDSVTDAELDAKGVCAGDDTHCENAAEPVY